MLSGLVRRTALTGVTSNFCVQSHAARSNSLLWRPFSPQLWCLWLGNLLCLRQPVRVSLLGTIAASVPSTGSAFVADEQPTSRRRGQECGVQAPAWAWAPPDLTLQP